LIGNSMNTVVVTRIIRGEEPGAEVLRSTLVSESNSIGACPYCAAYVSVLEANAAYGKGDWESTNRHECPHCGHLLRRVRPLYGNHTIWEMVTEEIA
jgi:DNA-directed RNA polymerase subunit RPC12/RpoP